MTIEIYELRKKLVELVDSQEGIRSVFRRMVSLFLTFVALLIFLGFVGISVNTLVISGAASISSITVALSESVFKRDTSGWETSFEEIS